MVGIRMLFIFRTMQNPGDISHRQSLKESDSMLGDEIWKTNTARER